MLNALNLQLVRELDSALTDLEQDDDVGAIVITGAGERAFSAGEDIHENRELSSEERDLVAPRKNQVHLAPGYLLQAGYRLGQQAVLRRWNRTGHVYGLSPGLRAHQFPLPGGKLRADERHMELAYYGGLAPDQGVVL